MSKQKLVYVCQNCGFKSAKWMGKCTDCNHWNSFVEEVEAVAKKGRPSASILDNYPQEISEVSSENYQRSTTYFQEFDRVLGGGIVPGSLILIGGEPGIGKSTLITEVLGKIASNTGQKVLYVTGEESLGQVAQRAKRLQINCKKFLVYHQNSWQKILASIQQEKPAIIVLDSIQTTVSEEIPAPPGTVSQVREVTYELMNYVKPMGITAFVIGHITKDGSIAGPKILEHMVDTVIYFEGDQFNQYRILRAIKNRFGNTNEVGIFDMSENGLKEVVNPSSFFLDSPTTGAFGRCITCIVEGSRPLFVEVQALVVDNKFGNGRRTSQGIDGNRVSMLVAVLEKYLNVAIGHYDIYVNIVGGLKIYSREIDLAVMAALLSSYCARPVNHRMIFLGEVGLTGEVRTVSNMEKRLKEAVLLQYEFAMISDKSFQEMASKYPLEMKGIKTIKDPAFVQLFFQK